jgi:Uma2 family endonuclease
MAAVAEKLTFAEFQLKYSHGDRSYEYWYGEAVPKARPTWIHGLLQAILAQLLNEAGYSAGSEVELRIDPDACPKPDVIATSREVEEPYPTGAVDIVIEILSKDDPMPYLLEKCQAYGSWGFEYIYVVNPESKQLFRWTGSGLQITGSLVAIPAERIWQELEKSLHRPR